MVRGNTTFITIVEHDIFYLLYKLQVFHQYKMSEAIIGDCFSHVKLS